MSRSTWIAGILPGLLLVVGCSGEKVGTDAAGEERELTQSPVAHPQPSNVSSRAWSTTTSSTSRSPESALAGIRSYLVDLGGKLRVGPADAWQMKASSAAYIVGQMQTDVDVLAQAGWPVGQLRSWLQSLSEDISGATETDWNRVVRQGQSTVLEMESLLHRMEKEYQGN